jgi:hypothetical protein
MGCFRAVMIVGLTLVGVSAAPADLLWDNFLSDRDGFDGITWISSEKDTTIVGTWAGDDAIFAIPVTVTGVEWLAVRDPLYTYTAEVTILDDSLSPIHTFTALPYTAVVLDEDVFDYQAYRGIAEIPPIDLPAGHYYVAARLATNGAGTNRMLSTGAGTINGETMAVFQSDHFAIPWSLLGDIGAPVTDLAYRIYGTPEPATAGLLATGLLLLRRRRAT